MTTINIDKIEVARHMAADEMGLDDANANNLTKGFHGNFFMKFADNKYKAFEQDLVADPKEQEIHVTDEDEASLAPEEVNAKINKLEGDLSMLMVASPEVDDILIED